MSENGLIAGELGLEKTPLDPLRDLGGFFVVGHEDEQRDVGILPHQRAFSLQTPAQHFKKITTIPDLMLRMGKEDPVT